MKVAGLFGSMSLTPSGPSAEPMFVAHKCARCEPAAQFRVVLHKKFLSEIWMEGSDRKMAGVAGLEPAHGRIKTSCLTAWLYP